MLQVSIRIVSLFNHSGDNASAGWLSLDRLGPFLLQDVQRKSVAVFTHTSNSA